MIEFKREDSNTEELKDIEDYRLVEEVVIYDIKGREIDKVYQKKPTHRVRIALIKADARFCQFNDSMVDHGLIYDALDDEFITKFDMQTKLEREDTE